MIIVIDGYNLLKQIFPGAKKNLERQRNSFLQQLAFYKSKKAERVSQLIVVFDAGPSTHATRTVKSNVVIVYSGTKSSADDWILDFVTRNRNQEILVVTLDRQLRKSCQKFGADWLNVYEFYKILQTNLLEEALAGSYHQQEQGFEKYETMDLLESDLEKYHEAPSNQALDLLMEQASTSLPEEKLLDKADKQAYIKVKSDTPSKKEKRIQAKIKKIQ